MQQKKDFTMAATARMPTIIELSRRLRHARQQSKRQMPLKRLTLTKTGIGRGSQRQAAHQTLTESKMSNAENVAWSSGRWANIRYQEGLPENTELLDARVVVNEAGDTFLELLISSPELPKDSDGNTFRKVCSAGIWQDPEPGEKVLRFCEFKVVYESPSAIYRDKATGRVV